MSTYTFRGVKPDGTKVSGTKQIGHLTAWVERRVNAGWKKLSVERDEWEYAGIYTYQGRRKWWVADR